MLWSSNYISKHQDVNIMGSSKKQAKMVAIDIGISQDNREKIVKGLSRLLADSYTLYLMTHNFHWNVTGPQFNSLHNMANSNMRCDSFKSLMIINKLSKLL